MRKKCSSSRGMTLMEILCAIAVLGLLTGAIAFALPSTVRTYQSITTGSEASVLLSTLNTALSEELRYASDIHVTEAGALEQYSSERFGNAVKITFVTNAQEQVYIGVEQKQDDQSVFPLISQRAYTSGLSLYAENDASRIVYLPEKKLFYVALTVYNKNTERYVWNEFYVQPLNAPKTSTE